MARRNSWRRRSRGKLWSVSRPDGGRVKAHWNRRMYNVWYRALYRFVDALYFARISVIHLATANGEESNRQTPGPTLYLGLHRNGAVDGFVYYCALDNPVFLISTQ